MSRGVPIRFLRATRSALDAQASGNGLLEGEPYLITDEGGFAVGTGSGAYAYIGPRNPPVSTPSGPSATGIPGQWAWDGTYLYWCVASNTWVRYVAERSW